MVMAAVGLLKTNPNPSEQDIARLMDRSVCRCGTYPRIVQAVRLAAQRMQTRTSPIGGGEMDRLAPSMLEPERYELSEARRYTFELERRDFIRLFGGGLVVMVAASDALAQESGRARPQGRGDTPDLAAWLHIDETGAVHVSTGKVELGQNIRTSLAQTVADELRVPLASITLVMADTDKTPFDQGTFGSQTTPRMAPQLAKAAATAREMLIDQAARTLAGRSRDADGARRPDRRRRRTRAGLRRADEGAGADGHDSRPRRRSTRRRPVEAPRDRGEEGERPRLRHGPPPVHAGHRPARHALRADRPSRRLRRHARERGRCAARGRWPA